MLRPWKIRRLEGASWMHWERSHSLKAHTFHIMAGRKINFVVKAEMFVHFVVKRFLPSFPRQGERWPLLAEAVRLLLPTLYASASSSALLRTRGQMRGRCRKCAAMGYDDEKCWLHQLAWLSNEMKAVNVVGMFLYYCRDTFYAVSGVALLHLSPTLHILHVLSDKESPASLVILMCICKDARREFLSW